MSNWRQAAMRRKEDDSAEEREAQEAQKELEAAAARHKRRQDFAEQWELATSPSADIANELRIQQVEKLRQGIVATDGEAVAKRVTLALTNGFETTERRPDLRVPTTWDESLTAAHYAKRLKISDKLARKVATCAKQISHDIPRSDADVDRERRRLLRELGKTIEKNKWLPFVDRLPGNAARYVLEGICEDNIEDDELDELLLKNRQTWSQFRSLKDSMVGLIEQAQDKLSTKPNQTDLGSAESKQQTFSPKSLRKELDDISSETLRRWAKAAGVNVPAGRGNRTFHYSLASAKAICNHGMKWAASEKARQTAQRFLKELELMG